MQRLNVVNFKAGTGAVGAAIAVTSQNEQAHTLPRLTVYLPMQPRQRNSSTLLPELPRPSKKRQPPR